MNARVSTGALDEFGDVAQRCVLCAASQIVTGYKNMIPGDQWAQFHAAFPDYLSQRLAERYQL
eukprot:6197704-Pleurochrysis_carterae.AAC.2